MKHELLLVMMIMLDVTTSAIFSMATKLWGGNEQIGKKVVSSISMNWLLTWRFLVNYFHKTLHKIGCYFW